jgi:hypothetical protein
MWPPSYVEESPVEVKIGVRNAPRELIVESSQTPDEVRKAVQDALSGKTGILELSDDRGRSVVVVAEHLTYVDIGEAGERRVGFGL